MNHLRLSLAGLMAIVLLIALAFAAHLNAAEPLWASGVFMFTVALLSAAVLGTVASRGKMKRRPKSSNSRMIINHDSCSGTPVGRAKAPESSWM